MKVLTGTQKKTDLYRYCYKCKTRFNVINYSFSCRLHRLDKNGKCQDCESYLTNTHDCYHIITPPLYKRLLNFL